ncbi:hypothetical protein BGW41_006829 [Actinomortierella wolfii]|nr:hypothetical protein BGW41_006829 [Actinomortierella wolfii]
MSSQQNSNTATTGVSSSSGRPPIVHSHSTHASLETFDQATRDAAAMAAKKREMQAMEQIEQRSSPTSSTSSSSSRSRGAGLSAKAMGNKSRGELENSVDSFDANDAYILQANSAVQLDRDVHRSRGLLDDSKQKGVHGQTPSAEAIPPNSNETTYIG